MGHRSRSVKPGCHKIAQQPCIWQLSNQQLHGRSGGRVGPINMCQFDKWRPVPLL